MRTITFVSKSLKYLLFRYKALASLRTHPPLVVLFVFLDTHIKGNFFLWGTTALYLPVETYGIKPFYLSLRQTI